VTPPIHSIAGPVRQGIVVLSLLTGEQIGMLPGFFGMGVSRIGHLFGILGEVV
jgi:hypothetical protein